MKKNNKPLQSLIQWLKPEALRIHVCRMRDTRLAIKEAKQRHKRNEA